MQTMQISYLHHTSALVTQYHWNDTKLMRFKYKLAYYVPDNMPCSNSHPLFNAGLFILTKTKAEESQIGLRRMNIEGCSLTDIWAKFKSLKFKTVGMWCHAAVPIHPVWTWPVTSSHWNHSTFSSAWVTYVKLNEVFRFCSFPSR